LELAVLGGVDERVDEAAGEHRYKRKSEVPTSEVNVAAAELHSEHDRVRCETDDEAAADDQ